MMDLGSLSPTQLLALIAVNFGPILRNRDGRWRSNWNGFPVEGIGEDDVQFLRGENLIEVTPTVAVVTDLGRGVLQAEGARGAFSMPSARRGTQGAHLSLQ